MPSTGHRGTSKIFLHQTYRSPVERQSLRDPSNTDADASFNFLLNASFQEVEFVHENTFVVCATSSSLLYLFELSCSDGSTTPDPVSLLRRPNRFCLDCHDVLPTSNLVVRFFVIRIWVYLWLISWGARYRSLRSP